MDLLSGLLGQKAPEFMTAAGFSDSPHLMYSGNLIAMISYNIPPLLIYSSIQATEKTAPGTNSITSASAVSPLVRSATAPMATASGPP